MKYFMLFLEGIITFISPCLLPMLPIYISYFSGGKEKSIIRTAFNAFGFVFGFSIMFVLMGVLAGTLGSFLNQYRVAVNIVTGGIVVLFGLSYMGLFELKFLRGINMPIKTEGLSCFSSVVFGVIFSIGWTPCVGIHLGTALSLAANEGNMVTSAVMLLAYSIGLGIPFIISALLIDRLKKVFNFIKKNYSVVTFVCGAFLIIVGILMMTGLIDRFLGLLN